MLPARQYAPEGHAKHWLGALTLEGAGEYEPSGQGTPDAVPAGHQRAGGHGAGATPAPGQAYPAGHCAHAPCAGAQARRFDRYL